MGNKILYCDDRFAIKGIDGNYYPLPCNWSIENAEPIYMGNFNLPTMKKITLEVYDGILTKTLHGLMTESVSGRSVKNVIINPPATIVVWGDGTKTVCKCAKGDTFDAEKGIAMCFMKKMFGNSSRVRKFMKKWIPWMVMSRVKQKDVMDNRKAYNGNSTMVKGEE